MKVVNINFERLGIGKIFDTCGDEEYRKFFRKDYHPKEWYCIYDEEYGHKNLFKIEDFITLTELRKQKLQKIEKSTL